MKPKVPDRWQSLIAALLLITLVGCTSETTGGRVAVDESTPELPETELLESSMRQQPVPGWSTDIHSLGLPDGSGVLPLVNTDDRAIMLGVTDKDWRLVGLDMADGKQFLQPLELGPAADADVRCSVNRPPDVLCVWIPTDSAAPSRAVVIDTDTGQVNFDGPTELRASSSSDGPRLEQIGDYAVATVTDKGVYGIGPRAELTWFVPGDGILPTQFTEPQRDTAAPVLAIQGDGATGDVVFSVADGKVINPEVAGDVDLGQAMVYPNGFAYEFTPKADITKERVAFFDNAGRKLREFNSDGILEIGSPDLPVVLTPRHEFVTTVDGEELLELPRTLPSSEARLIASRFFISSDSGHEWDQFDLRSGDPGKSCQGDYLGAYYLGSDGDVAVSVGELTVLQGVDLATCETLWALDGTPEEVVRVWRVHNTLVQRSGDKLFSLVAAA
ncbi:hypothetical protein ACWDUN_09770 [Mycobacterium sp. NPDC003323]